jgi:hypothetical protein
LSVDFQRSSLLASYGFGAFGRGDFKNRALKAAAAARPRTAALHHWHASARPANGGRLWALIGTFSDAPFALISVHTGEAEIIHSF